MSAINCKKVLICSLSVLFVVSILGASGGSLKAQGIGTPDLVITGTGLTQDVYLYKADWENFNNPNFVERYYSSNNNFDFHKIWKVKGYDLFALIDGKLINDGTDWSISFEAEDGAKITRTINQLQSIYYYSDFTLSRGVLVNPMIGIFRVELYTNNAPSPPINWTDRSLVEADKDNNAPRLYFGQASGNVSDINQQFYLRDLVRIVIGQERPVVPETYTITSSPVVGGTATVTTTPSASASAGATVTVNISGIESGKRFKSLEVKDSSSAIVPVTAITAGSHYNFTMPAKAVTVAVQLDNIEADEKKPDTDVGGEKKQEEAPAADPDEEPETAQQESILKITGTGLFKDVMISSLDDFEEIERFYSSNNNFDFHKIWKVKGYDLMELIGKENLKDNQDYPITFVAADGLKITRTLSELQNLYYYPDFTLNSEETVAPMIGFYRAELLDAQGFPESVTWSDRQFTSADWDDRSPRLYIGQQKGNLSDKNQQYFVRELTEIIIGEAPGVEPAPADPVLPGQDISAPESEKAGTPGTKATPSTGGGSLAGILSTLLVILFIIALVKKSVQPGHK